MVYVWQRFFSGITEFSTSLIFQKFSGDSIPNRVKKYVVKNGVVTKLVRFHPEVWQDYPVLRVEIYGTPASPLPGKNHCLPFLFYLLAPIVFINAFFLGSSIPHVVA